MVGEWLVEEDEGGGRGHVPPVQEVVQLRSPWPRPLPHPLLGGLTMGQKLSSVWDGGEGDGVRVHQTS